MIEHAFLVKKVKNLRRQNMLGLRTRVSRSAPNTYLIEGGPSAPVCGFLSCSYLGLEMDERLIEGAIRAVRECGTQFSSSRAIASTHHYGLLEDHLAAMMGVPAIVSSTSTLGHLSALPVLVRANDAIVLDMQVHNSVHMAARSCTLAGAATVRIAHNDLAALESEIVRLSAEGRERIWFLADGLYSMYGDFLDMEAIFALLRKYPNFHCYVDDAHSVGWLGRHGSGHASPWFGRPGSERMVVIGSMAKAFGAGGGMILTSNDDWRDAISLCGETMIFSGPIQPAVCGSLVAACDIMLSDELPSLQEATQRNIHFFGEVLRDRGIETLSSGKAPIFLIEIGSMERLEKLSAFMLESGYYAPPVTFPAVALNRFCIRVVVNRLHTKGQMEGLADCIAEFGRGAGRAGVH